ncbi:hypothetical protein Hs30E_16220 [Lactococcus hodotermopsidis]|uniref:Uncharacterized protein n=1 Tax=Pseudolactococcus hodotermopsidis TaxID=2709157 RepID=A0A6A0BFL7_9LACT|nr:hypothetical protein [Lactococcus hodotermopsidis]GFH43071.1 hypothetical protein Hs30E_16220 [Lactococcus hodotermopsidis]
MLVDESKNYKEYTIHYSWHIIRKEWVISALDIMAVVIGKTERTKVRYQWNKLKKARLIEEDDSYSVYRMADAKGIERLTEVVTVWQAIKLINITDIAVEEQFIEWLMSLNEEFQERAKTLPSLDELFHSNNSWEREFIKNFEE